MVISEKQILSEIEKVLKEHRKVIKLPNTAPQPEPVPAAQPPMQPDMQQGAMPPMDGGAEPGMDPNMGGMPADDGSSQFDTNFDAGVEADEDSDPKRYIQQLTGKLSQSINSFNSEQGPDAGLCKYVASMIIAATCKNLDDKQKKELIEKINSAQGDDMEGDESDDMDSEDMPMDDMDGSNMEQQEPMPMNERIITKQELMELVQGWDSEDKPMEIQKQKQNNCPKAWRSKFK